MSDPCGRDPKTPPGRRRPTPTGPPRPQPRNLIHLTDEQLLIERDRRRAVVDQLVRHPGTSPAVGPLLERADADIERITAELLVRVVARGEWSSDPLPHSQLT